MACSLDRAPARCRMFHCAEVGSDSAPVAEDHFEGVFPDQQLRIWEKNRGEGLAGQEC